MSVEQPTDRKSESAMHTVFVRELHRAGQLMIIIPPHMFPLVEAAPIGAQARHPQWLGEMVDPDDVAHPGEW